MDNIGCLEQSESTFEIGSLCNSIVPHIWHLVTNQVHFQTKRERLDGLSFVTLSISPSLSQPSNVYILCDPSRRRPFFCWVCLNIKLLVKFVTKVMAPLTKFGDGLSKATFSTNAPLRFVFFGRYPKMWHTDGLLSVVHRGACKMRS